MSRLENVVPLITDLCHQFLPERLLQGSASCDFNGAWNSIIIFNLHSSIRTQNSPVLRHEDGEEQGNFKLWDYSHSMVPGGLEVTSRTTRLTPSTSLVMRLEIFESRS